MMTVAVPGQRTPGDPDLTPRQRQIFNALLQMHEANARPVGSEALARHEEISVSAASIRAELAELETLGFLERPRSSSGRLPTARGYDYYIRNLVRPRALPAELAAEVRGTLERSARDVERLLHDASRVLSSLTHQLGLAQVTPLAHEILTGLELARFSERRVLLVLHVGEVGVRTLALELESDFDSDQLREVEAVLRERLLGKTLAEARDRLDWDPELVRKSAVRIVVAAAVQQWSDPVGTPLFRSGAQHMAEQPEFARATELGALLQALETGTRLERLLASGIEGQVAAHVGLRHERALAGCSLVAYSLTGPVAAAIGVLGPLRMNYALAFSVVEMVGDQVADLLSA
jgi:heat-inducible transcriptional repressor